LAALGVVTIASVAVWAMTRPGVPETGPQPASGASLTSKDVPLVDLSGKAPERPGAKILATNTPAADHPVVELRQGRNTGGPPDPQGVQPQKPPVELGHTPGSGGPATLTNPTAAPSESTPASVPASTPAAPSMSAAADLEPTIAAAKQKQAAGDLVAARVLYSRALGDSRLGEADRQAVRGELTRINDDLVFSPRVTKDDPYVDTYAVQARDSLIKISQKLGLGPDYRLIRRVNKMADEHKLILGQKLKVVKGPFHALVTKSAYRLDLYMGPTDKPEQWVYIRSFPVGLGEANGTPVGTFIVKKGSKLIDPPWINPRTGERFAGNDPKNPIGHRWIGLEGTGESAQFTGYGLHGTIDPDSIGKQRSMGCVRMGNEDIELMFELLGEQVSVVKIQP
jgi:LysM repeat protein